MRGAALGIAVALGAALGVALLAPTGMRSTRFGDYALQVENLKAGRGLVDGEGRVMHRYPPLYPLMLWGLDGLSERTGLPLSKVLAGFAVLCNAAMAVLSPFAGYWGRDSGRWRVRPQDRQKSGW